MKVTATKDFNDMTGAELVAAYNEMCAVANTHGEIAHRPVKKFESLVTGIHRCQALQRELNGGIPTFLQRTGGIPKEEPPAPPPAVVETSESQILREADSRWRNWQPTPGCMSRPRRSSFARQIREEQATKATAALTATTPSLVHAGKSKRADRVIRTLVDANPRRPGSEAHKYFEAMKGGITVGEYLAKFDKSDHRRAAQWLWNTVNDGFIKLLG